MQIVALPDAYSNTGMCLYMQVWKTRSVTIVTNDNYKSVFQQGDSRFQ